MKVPAILFIVFNRPKVAQKVIEAIRKAKPVKLYIAADGPRVGKEDERELCEQTRHFALNSIDWECDVKTLFREENLGCGLAVSSAITWFFENEEQGIILEDDCLPNESFFIFCEELLNKYKDDGSIGIISGNNFQKEKHGECSYYFSNIINMWGWATWARAWKDFKFDVNELNEEQITGEIKRRFSDKRVINYWIGIYGKMKNLEIDTWDYQFYFSQIAQKRVFVCPNVNLISNIGFGEDSTHTFDESNPAANMPTQLMDFPLSHPAEITVNQKADKFFSDNFYLRKKPLLKRIANKLKRIGLISNRRKIR